MTLFDMPEQPEPARIIGEPGFRTSARTEPSPIWFDGATYSAGLDCARLTGQLLRVHDALGHSGQRWTLRALADHTGGSEAAVSARLRDLRKERFGAHTICRERIGVTGLFEYWLELPDGPRPPCCNPETA